MAAREAEPVRRLLSGVRPYGALHLGHYVGTLRQWLGYQHEYECHFLIADVQALAAHAERPDVIRESVREVALDWLAVGLDPAKGSFVVQSRIPELAELTVYLQMLVQTGELCRNPALREEARRLGKGYLDEDASEVAFGFLGYPVSQVADILAFSTAPPRTGDSLIVPVGEDQLAYVAFARDVARRFNTTYGEVFLEPEARTASVAHLPGTDGGCAMGRSRRNTILLKEPEAEYTEKIRRMFSDPLRARLEDPGHPDACPCFLYYQALGWDRSELDRRYADCLAARTDCRECKEDLVRGLKALLDPIQERRRRFERDPALVADALAEGTRRGRAVVRRTVERVREALRLADPDAGARTVMPARAARARANPPGKVG